jgi:hypothetical protein
MNSNPAAPIEGNLDATEAPDTAEMRAWTAPAEPIAKTVCVVAKAAQTPTIVAEMADASTRSCIGWSGVPGALAEPQKASTVPPHAFRTEAFPRLRFSPAPMPKLSFRQR